MDRKVYEFISKQSGDPIVEWRTCKWTGEEFPIFQLQKTIEESMGMTYQQDISPSAMFRSISMFRNERHLYKNISVKSGKPLITMYSTESKVNVYDTPEFWAEDFLSTKQSIPTKLDEMIQAFATLSVQVPKLAKINDRNENAEYANYVGSCKNIYMSFLSYYEAEDVYYSYYTIPGKDIVDCFYIKNADLCYESINVFDSYAIFFSYNINNSQNCYFSFDLDNCHHCLFCHNLRGKSYYIHNTEYSKSEFEAYFSQMKANMKKYSELQKYLTDYQNILSSAIYQHVNQVNSEKCIWDTLVNCNRSILAFDSRESNESVNVRWWPFEKCLNIIGWYADYVVNSWRVGAGVAGEMSSRILWCYNTYTSHDIVSCQDLIWCSHMLFCCGLKNKEYCILNKQFSKQEREELSDAIIKNMKLAGMYGQPLPHELSRFPYNDTVANDLFPIKSVVIGDQIKIINPNGEGIVTVLQPDMFISDAILDLGGQEKIKIKRRTRDTEINIPEHFQKIWAQDLPDSIDDVDDTILDKVIMCEVSGRPFRIIGPELTFYRKHGLPLPRRHHDIRHQARRDRRPQRNLYLRNCDNCWIEMLSVYKQESEFKVFCEACYNKEIYW